MRIEIAILLVTGLLIYDTYHDGKYRKLLISFKKYYQMVFFGILGIGIYLILKRNPTQGKQILHYANNVVKYMPIDKSAIDMITPIFDFTSSEPERGQSFMESLNDINPIKYGGLERKMMNTGTRKDSVKRSVSETKKKFVAYSQEWKCGKCKSQLDHTFEIDHKIRLEYGGGNEVNNLVALCRNCHGHKTASENM